MAAYSYVKGIQICMVIMFFMLKITWLLALNLQNGVA